MCLFLAKNLSTFCPCILRLCVRRNLKFKIEQRKFRGSLTFMLWHGYHCLVSAKFTVRIKKTQSSVMWKFHSLTRKKAPIKLGYNLKTPVTSKWSQILCIRGIWKVAWRYLRARLDAIYCQQTCKHFIWRESAWAPVQEKPHRNLLSQNSFRHA